MCASAQVKAGDTFENLLNEVVQIICSFKQKKPKKHIHVTIVYSKKKVYNNIINSINV